MNYAIAPVNTVTHAIGATPYVFPDDGSGRTRLIRIFANVSARVAIGATATEGDMPVAANEAILVELPPTNSLAIVAGSGESSGFVWLSEIKRV